MSQATERAVLAGGCFWGMQDLIRKRPGVIATRVGYTGGDVENATYRNHGSHAEAIEITFDPEQESFRGLLEFFFQIHDPTTKNRQGNDVGASYRSAIFYTDDEQRAIAEDTIADVDASELWPGKVVTEVVQAGPFWSPSTRTTSSAMQLATPVTSSAPTGSSHAERRTLDRANVRNAPSHDALVRRPNARCARIISVDLTADLPNDRRERMITPRRLHA